MKILNLFDAISCPHTRFADSTPFIHDLMRQEKLNYLPPLDDNGKMFGCIDRDVITESYD